MAPVACQRPGCFEPVTATLYQLCSRHWEEFNQGAFTIIKPDPKEVRTVSSTGGEKGQKDIRLHAIPWEALQLVGKVYAFGQEKYSDYNFRKGYDWSLSFDAMQRHQWAFWSGEEIDPESGLPHMAHVAWHAFTLALFSSDERYDQFDDRPWVSDLKAKIQEAYSVHRDQDN